MAKRKATPAARRGLNLAPSDALDARLVRAYAPMNAAALAAASLWIPRVFSGGANRAKAEQEIQAAADEAMPDSRIEQASRKAAEEQDGLSQRLFFPALGATIGATILGNDGPAGGARQIVSVASIERPSLSRRRKPLLVARLNMQPEILMDQFVSKNVEFISTLRSGIAEGVGDAIVRAKLLPGETQEDLVQRLLKQWRKDGVPSKIPIRRTTKNGDPVLLSAEKHARFIARDQMATLNGELAKARQTAAGVSEFKWQTQKDSKVREEHRELQGRVFKWSEGAPGGIYPGQPINCRCWPQAVVSDAEVIATGNFIDVDRAQNAGRGFTTRGNPGISQRNPGPGAAL